MATAMSHAVVTPCSRAAHSCPRTSSVRSIASSSSSLVVKRSTWNSKLVSARQGAGVRALAVDISKIVPQADRILISLDTLAEQSSGGVLLPKAAVKYERYLVGKVLAVGSEVQKVEKGNRHSSKYLSMAQIGAVGAVGAMAGAAPIFVRGGVGAPLSSSSNLCVSKGAACGGLASIGFPSFAVAVRRRRDVVAAGAAADDVFFSKSAALPALLRDEDRAGSEDLGEPGLEARELKDYPPGFRRYETMAVLRPDISEEQRLALTQRYEEAIIASGGLDVEMFNRGMQPLAYNVTRRNMSGVSNRYLDGIYLLFTYAAKPESQLVLQKRLNGDDDIIRSTSFKLKV